VVYYLIPARSGSKGFPGKNRVLAPLIKKRLKKKVQYRTVVTTDDEEIAESFRESPVKVVNRPPELAEDETPIKPVIEHVISKMRFYPSDDVVLLYPTYPSRTWGDIKAALHWYQKREARTMLCAQPALPSTPTHLAVSLNEDGTATHPLSDGAYRRQDASGTVESEGADPQQLRELSHFVCAFKVGELPDLTDNIFNHRTLYHELDERVIDVDEKEDWERYQSRAEKI
jgi:CMP-N-acetylneuraminic acid synthetase